MLGLMVTLFACEKSEIELQDVNKSNNTPLSLDQITTFLEDMNIDVSSKTITDAAARGSDLVEASYVMPGLNFAEASNGETFGIEGAGDLTLHSKSVCGGGNWVHNDANGDPIASGSWEAEKLMSFKDYGPSDFIDEEGEPIPQFIHAGKSIMRIHLGEPANVDAILTIYCILPEVATPPSWPEGIKISIQHGGPNFNQVLQGGTFFAVPALSVCPD